MTSLISARGVLFNGGHGLGVPRLRRRHRLHELRGVALDGRRLTLRVLGVRLIEALGKSPLERLQCDARLGARLLERGRREPLPRCERSRRLVLVLAQRRRGLLCQLGRLCLLTHMGHLQRLERRVRRRKPLRVLATPFLALPHLVVGGGQIACVPHRLRDHLLFEPRRARLGLFVMLLARRNARLALGHGRLQLTKLAKEGGERANIGGAPRPLCGRPTCHGQRLPAAQCATQLQLGHKPKQSRRGREQLRLGAHLSATALRPGAQRRSSVERLAHRHRPRDSRCQRRVRTPLLCTHAQRPPAGRITACVTLACPALEAAPRCQTIGR